MDRTHVAALYRKTETGSQDDRGRPVTTWSKLVAGVEGNLQETAGRVVQQPSGREVRVVGKFFAAPTAWPGGVTPQADDGLLITSGRSSRTTFLVTHAALWGDGPFDDELELAATAEAIP